MLKIKQLRKDRGLSQEKLAQRADVSVKTVRRVETLGTASTATLAKLAEALGVDVGALFSPNGSRKRRAS